MRNSEKGGTNDKGNGTEIDGERTKNAPRVPQPFVTCLHFPPFPKKKATQTRLVVHYALLNKNRILLNVASEGPRHILGCAQWASSSSV